MASNWWWQNPSGAWDFRCELNPSKIQATDPAAYARMKLEMAGIPEKDWSKLTECCGSKFFPWACGASRIMEFTINGTVHCILCERIPDKLNNQIKLQRLQWDEACEKLTPAQITACVPRCLPKANLCKACGPLTGISRFDFSKWKTEGEPTLGRAGWIALCRMIAENTGNKDCFRNIITLCDELAADNEENPDMKASNKVQTARRRLRQPRHPEAVTPFSSKQSIQSVQPMTLCKGLAVQ